MPKFSFKRSQTIDSDESEKSLPLNDTYTKDEVVGVQKKQGLVEKLKNKARRKRSKSPSRRRSKSPGRSYSVSEVGWSQPLKPSKKKQKRPKQLLKLQLAARGLCSAMFIVTLHFPSNRTQVSTSSDHEGHSDDDTIATTKKTILQLEL